MRLVLDTNVLLSALMSPESSCAELLTLWRNRKVTVLTAAEQMDEVARVTRYPKIRSVIPPALAGRLVNQLRDVAIVVEETTYRGSIADPGDKVPARAGRSGQGSIPGHCRQTAPQPEASQVNPDRYARRPA